MPLDIYGVQCDSTCGFCGDGCAEGDICHLCSQYQLWDDPEWPDLKAPEEPSDSFRLYGTVDSLEWEHQFRLRFSVEVPEGQKRSVLNLDVEGRSQAMPVNWGEMDPGQCRVMEMLQRQIELTDPAKSQPNLEQKFLKARKHPSWTAVIPDVCEVQWSFVSGGGIFADPNGPVCLRPIGGAEGKGGLYLDQGKVFVWEPSDLRPRIPEITEAVRKPVAITR